MADPIEDSQLMGAAMTTDGELVELQFGDPLTRSAKFEFTYEKFEHAMAMLSEFSLHLRKRKEAIGGLEMIVPLELVEETAEASLGGDIVFVRLRAKNSAHTTTYSLSPERARALGEKLIAESGGAKSERDAPRH